MYKVYANFSPRLRVNRSSRTRWTECLGAVSRDRHSIGFVFRTRVSTRVWLTLLVFKRHTLLLNRPKSARRVSQFVVERSNSIAAFRTSVRRIDSSNNTTVQLQNTNTRASTTPYQTQIQEPRLLRYCNWEIDRAGND
jgi:hypothetical protein